MGLNAIIGALRVNLGMDSASYTEKLNRVKEDTKAASASVAAAMAPLAGAIATAFSVSALKGHMEFIDAQAKMARSIDGSVNGLQALQLAGTDAGVSFETIGQAMQHLDMTLGQMSIVGGNSAKALKDIGLSASSLMKMDADQRLAAIADRVKQLGLNSSQTAGLLGLLGIRNKEMTLLVMQGGAAIRGARKEVQGLGIAMSQVDVKKVEAANDAIKRVGLVFQGIGNQLTIALAPSLKTLADAFTAAAKPGGILNDVLSGLRASMGQLLTIAGTAAAFFAGRFAASFISFDAIVGTLTLSFEALKGAIATTGIGLLIIGVGEAIYWFGRLVDGAGGIGKALGLLGDVASEVWSRISLGPYYIWLRMQEAAAKIKVAWFEMIDTLTSKWAKFLKALGAVSSVMPGMSGFSVAAKNLASTSDSKKAIEDNKFYARAWQSQAENVAIHMTKPLASMKALHDAIFGTAKDSTSALHGTTAAANGLGTALTGAGNHAKTALSGAQKAAQSFTSQMKSDFQGLVTGTESWSTALSNILSHFASIEASSAFDAIFGKGITSGSSSGGWLSSLATSIFSGIGGNANGTPNFAGGLTAIHERGDEIAMMPKGSAILTHAQSQKLLNGASGSQAMNVTVNVQGANGDQHVISLVQQGVSAGLSAFNRHVLPVRVAQIKADPRRRG